MRMKKNFLKFLLSATVGITSVALVAGCGDSNTVLVNPLATYVQTVSTNLDESEKKVTIGASDWTYKDETATVTHASFITNVSTPIKDKIKELIGLKAAIFTAVEKEKDADENNAFVPKLEDASYAGKHTTLWYNIDTLTNGKSIDLLKNVKDAKTDDLKVENYSITMKLYGLEGEFSDKTNKKIVEISSFTIDKITITLTKQPA